MNNATCKFFGMVIVSCDALLYKIYNSNRLQYQDKGSYISNSIMK